MKRVGVRCLACSLSTLVAVSLTAFLAFGGQAARAQDDKKPVKQDRKEAAPNPGDVAPPFTLKMLDDATKQVELASFRGKKPVVLFFGSYT